MNDMGSAVRALPVPDDFRPPPCKCGASRSIRLRAHSLVTHPRGPTLPRGSRSKLPAPAHAHFHGSGAV
eukprot:7877235-Alexandrium_andersonii.AAC.1